MLSPEEKRKRLAAHWDERDRLEKVARYKAARARANLAQDMRRGQGFLSPYELPKGLPLREYVAPEANVQRVAGRFMAELAETSRRVGLTRKA